MTDYSICKNMCKTYSIIFFILFFTGCSITPKSSNNTSNWPAELPPENYFIEQYQAHKELDALQSQQNYLTWIQRFYKGWVLYPRGWDWMTENLLKETKDVKTKARIAQRLSDGGKLIAAEWAKDKSVRKIDSVNLMTWASALKIAVKENAQDEITDKIMQDVNALLNGSLATEDIDLDRYFPEDESIAAQDDYIENDLFDGV